MRSLFLFLALVFHSAFASQVTIKLEGKEVLFIKAEDTKSGIIKTKDNRFIGSLHRTLANPYRKYTRTYEGFSLVEVLKAAIKKNIEGYKLTFVATDGYRVKMSSKDFMNALQKHSPLIAYKETGKKGFTPFMKGKKMVDPGPFYLVWSNYKGDEDVSGKTIIKWPYMLSQILITKE